MGKKMNDFLATSTTNQTVCGASQKKHLRSRKPKFELGKGKPKQRFDDKRKDKKKKHKTLATQVAKRLEEFPLMFAEIRASNQRAREVMSEIDARILTQLKAWKDEDNGF